MSPAPNPTVACKTSPTGKHQFIGSNCQICGIGGIVVSGEVLYVPTEKQVDYHNRLEPNVLFWGGRGSGKSMCGRWDAHMRALSYPGYTYCILRRTFPELQKSHLIHINREMRQLGGTFHNGDHIAHYPNGSTGFFSHCATEEHVLNLLSSEFALMVFDELSTFEWEMFTKLAASVRVKEGSGLTAMVRGLTNPLGPSAQKLLEYFVEKEVDPDEDPDYNPNDWYSIHANLIDNPHLDQAQYQKRFSGLPAHVRKAWVDGEFILENALFDFHPKITAKMCVEKELSLDLVGKPYHVAPEIDWAKFIPAATIYRAIDAGWFPDPTVVLWIAHLGNRHVVIHEKTWYKTTAMDIAADILAEDKLIAQRVSPTYELRVAMTYCDPSMDINTTADIRTVKEIYEAHGVPMENSINNREMFAISMHNALAEEAGEAIPRLQIYAEGRKGCTMLLRTIPQMRFDPKRPKAMADHKDDHYVVAACYYLMSHSADLRGEYTQQAKPRRWMVEKSSDKFVLGRDNVRDAADWSKKN